MAQDSTYSIPRHLGLIIDGNRRWAKSRHLPAIEGHKQGYLNLKEIGSAALKQGVEYISVFVFSTENWNRERSEVKDIMKLLLWVMKHEILQFQKEGIRLRVIGSRLKLGKALIKSIHEAEEMTKNNNRGTLLLCLDYGGQQEIVEATKRIAEAGYKPDEITPDLITRFLYAPDLPPIDLIIRTSGEQRLSNFMLWESAYSELIFSEVNWPDFNEKELKKAIDEYGRRQRRFGA